MKYLSYILYPLCIGGAVYSLIYVQHKRFVKPNLSTKDSVWLMYNIFQNSQSNTNEKKKDRPSFLITNKLEITWFAPYYGLCNLIAIYKFVFFQR